MWPIGGAVSSSKKAEPIRRPQAESLLWDQEEGRGQEEGQGQESQRTGSYLKVTKAENVKGEQQNKTKEDMLQTYIKIRKCPPNTICQQNTLRD